MKKVSIITDSTSDLSKELLAQYDITVFPLHIHLGEKEYADGIDITPEEIYQWSEETKETPKTSALSLYDAKEYIKNALSKSSNVSNDPANLISIYFLSCLVLSYQSKSVLKHCR